MNDASPLVERRQDEILRAMSPAQRLALAASVSRAAETMALAGMRGRFPDATDRERFLRLALIKLGPDLACRVYPEAVGLVGRRT